MRPRRAPQTAARRPPRERPAPASSPRRENSVQRAVESLGTCAIGSVRVGNSSWVQYRRGRSSPISRIESCGSASASRLMMNNFAELGDRLLVIFDGHCGLCNRAVRWLVRRDSQDRLRFVAAESAKVAGLLARHGIGLRRRKIALPRSWLCGISGARRNNACALGGGAGSAGRVAAALAGGCRRAGLDSPARARSRLPADRPLAVPIWGRLENCPLPTAEYEKHFL